jgi:hypothetical protein
MNGIIIQEHLCPRCGIQRTVRLGLSNTSFCFNCHFQWGPGAMLGAPPCPTYLFTSADLERLTPYRNAIRNGLYGEWAETARAHHAPAVAGRSGT